MRLLCDVLVIAGTRGASAGNCCRADKRVGSETMRVIGGEC